MTALVTGVMLFVIGAHFYTLGPMLGDTGMDIYRFAFIVVTVSAAVSLFYTRERSNYAAVGAILAYCYIAPVAYNFDNPLLVSAIIDLAMAGGFALGAKRWHNYAAGLFLAAVAVSVFSHLGYITTDRPYTFIAFAQQDLTAIFGYAALISCGLGAGDGGIRIRDTLRRPGLAVIDLPSVVHRIRGLAQGKAT